MAPTIVFSALALLYVLLLHQPQWEARQSLLIREEAASGLSQGRPGRFDGLDSMKTAQETVLELVHSRSVVAAALQAVGPPGDRSLPQVWPTQLDVEQLQEAIQVKAPNGAEFGKTEVFYLLVRDKDRDRALALARALADQLDSHLQAVRDRRASSLVKELTRAVELALADRDAATEQLAALERSAGGDLAELRLLTETVGGESNLRMALTAVKNDLRQARVAQTNHRQLLAMLRQAQRDPAEFLAAPNDLLTSQPALQRLKEGLLEAQLATARLQGSMTDEHPLVRAAALAEAEIHGRVHHEIALAIRGLDAELELGKGRMATLQQQHDEIAARMNHLAGVRAHYANAASEARHFDELVKSAQQDLAAARATQAAAHTTSLLTRLEDPYTPHNPCGPRKAIIVLAGLVGGLATGLGLLFLLPLASPVAAAENRSGDLAAPAARPTLREAPPNGRPQRLTPTDEPVRILSLKQALSRLAKS